MPYLQTNHSRMNSTTQFETFNVTLAMTTLLSNEATDYSGKL